MLYVLSQTVSVSLKMCSSLYCTVSSLCFQFPKPCWHLGKTST